jgi:O-antigen/teichoic acid export membrane protein
MSLAGSILIHVRTPLYRNAYALTVASGVTSALGFAYWILAAHYYSVSIVGANSAVVSSMMFLSGIAQLNLVSALVRFVPAAGRVTRRFVTSSYLVSSCAAVVVGFVFISGLSIWSPKLSLLGSNHLTTLWFILAVLAYGIFALQDQVLSGMRQTTWVVIENAIFSILKIVLLVIFARPFPQYGIFSSWTIAIFMAVIPVNLLIFGRLIPQHARETESHAEPIIPSQIVRYVAVDYLGTLCSLASTTLLPLIVTQLVGERANAYFYLSWIIAYSIQMVTINATISFTVEAVRDRDQLESLSCRMLLHLTRLIVPAVGVLVLLAPYLLAVAGRQYPAEGAPVLRLLALGALPNIVNTLYMSIARIRRGMLRVLVTQVALSGIMLSLTPVLVHVYGITGVGLAWLIGQTVVASVLMMTELRPLMGLVCLELRGS